MLRKLKKTIGRHLVNIPGWRTDRKIVVFESDDWGMIRMASRNTYEWFLNQGYKVDECPFNRYDALESDEDLERLFDVLSSVSDCHGNPAVFTANNIVANPDFEKIKDSGFQEYYFEPFTETLKKYPGREKVMSLYKQGIIRKIFRPQFHGREHLNVNRWMDGLNSGNKILLDAFEQKMFAVHKFGHSRGFRQNLDAFGMSCDKEWVSMEDVIHSGLDLFEDIWGYRSLSFIAPCYIWPVEIEGVLFENGVKYLQGTHVQRIPSKNGKTGFKKKYHYQAQKNRFGQKYFVRNVAFEPALNSFEDSVSNALKKIESAFKYKKPAIISSHRINYIGSIDSKNRDRNLKLLKSLLKQIQKKWPNIEFMTSCELGRCIENSEK